MSALIGTRIALAITAVWLIAMIVVGSSMGMFGGMFEGFLPTGSGSAASGTSATGRSAQSTAATGRPAPTATVRR